MIKKTEKIKLKKVLKSKWIPEVMSKLAEKEILSKKGVPYTKAYISHVFNGINSNDDIEIAIFEVYNERKNKQSNLRVFKKEIL
ncbi:hypothetical protein LXD69_10045 [Flavobacterium sediminilitoris]|uniref:Uncharacterized protein n=1 Tax=Flavobacterium sediminilitoris TaxID=2024526 RepID=A0ABY4HIK3_9FLAO|nr:MULTISPECIES: hypothetical protein [Flavobacterium]UOX32393.1 hypothetical protein LXD69_10045 [Flavobacterium sediminilitoris]